MIFSIEHPARRSEIALVHASTGVSWTFAKLSEEVRRRCDALNGSPRGLLFLFCHNDPNSVAWYLAALESGMPVLLVSAALDKRLQSELFRLYRPDLVVAESAPGFHEYRNAGADGLWQRTERKDDALQPQLSLLLSTSGSTGSPKLVRLSKANVVANATSIREALRIEPDHFPVAYLPLHYSYGLSVVNSHLLAGAKVLLTDSGLTSADFWQAIRTHRATSFSGVPYAYQVLRRLGLDKVDVPSLRIFTQAGGKLDTANIAHFHEQITARGGTFWVMYGQTEATARITVLPTEELPRKLGSAGKAIPGGKLSIKTETGEVTTASRAAGELIYEGPNVMMGYAEKREDLSKGDELRGRLETGDRAFLDDEAFVYVVGRAKRDAKLFGLRINLDELEAFVKKSGPAAAVGAGDRVVIFCEFGNDERLRQIRQELSTLMQIHSSAIQLCRIDQLPIKPSGKINYEELQQLL